MIEIKNKANCCGCKACGDACPNNAITYKTDIEGFWYPEIDKNLCVDCGLCEKVCPLLNTDFSNLGNLINPDSYILQAPSLYDRLNSASGAAYTLFIRAVFESGGYVAGHIWKDKSNVVGYVSRNPEDLGILRSTKYLQSDTAGLYKVVKNLLNQGKYVFFSGCPCQNAAIRRYLRKEYENLITTDFICMGIDSPYAFAKYIESLENQYHSKIVYFKAKSKEVGWRHLTNKAIFENGRTYFGINKKDANLKATFLNVLVRPSCYDCKFKGFPRVSDITIGDYWRNKYDFDPFDDNTGTSYVILNNNKARTLFNKIKKFCNYREVQLEDILGANKLAIHSLPKPLFNRNIFYSQLINEDFSILVDKYYSEKNQSGRLTKTNVISAFKTLLKFIYVNRLNPISTIRLLHYNLFSSSVKTNLLNGDLLLVSNTKLKISKEAKLVVNGVCQIRNSYGKTIISLGKGSRLELDTNIIESGARIILQPYSSIIIGLRTVIGKNAILKSQTKIDIKEFCLIQDDAIIDDSDCGVIFFNEDYQQDKEIHLGTHTLVSRGAVLKGSTRIGDEVIIKENAIVKGVFAPRTVIAGNPAQVINNYVYWKFDF